MDSRKIILDTSAYSSFLRGHYKIKFAIQISDEIFINPIVIGELLSGFVMGKNGISV